MFNVPVHTLNFEVGTLNREGGGGELGAVKYFS
jgi:hypothetical protein